MTNKSIAIASPCLGNEERDSLDNTLASGWLTQGPKVAQFEQNFANRHEIDYALATTSCTTALHLALVTLGIGPGDEVIVPAFTWVASSNVVVMCGATPVFVDVDPTTYNLDSAAVARALTPKTKAVMPVHLFGLCADMDTLRGVLPDGIFVIEDAACAAGAAYKDRPAGSLGDMGCFSFHPRKIITTGEGGMLTTDDAGLAEQAKVLRNHGASVPEELRHSGIEPYILPEFDVMGFNYRMSDVQGALGVAQLGKLDGFIGERERWARWYREQLSDIGWLKAPFFPDGHDHSWQSFVTVVDPKTAPMSRNDIMKHFHARDIQTRPGTHAISELGYYKNRYNLKSADFPHARMLHHNALALPLHNRMVEDDFVSVMEVIREL